MRIEAQQNKVLRIELFHCMYISPTLTLHSSFQTNKTTPTTVFINMFAIH